MSYIFILFFIFFTSTLCTTTSCLLTLRNLDVIKRITSIAIANPQFLDDITVFMLFITVFMLYEDVITVPYTAFGIPKYRRPPIGLLCLDLKLTVLMLFRSSVT